MSGHLNTSNTPAVRVLLGHQVFSLGLFPTRVDGAKAKRHKTVASVTVVRSVTRNHRLCPHFVTELRVKLHNFFGPLFINREPALPALGN